jgi:transcription initiation factor TFIIB
MASRDIYETTFDEDVQRNDHNTCPECDGRVTANAHETVCDDCGLVIEDQSIDHGPEWRTFEDDAENKRRTGPSNTVARHDRGIGTEIGWDKDATGKDIGGRKRRQIKRLRREHTRAQIGTKADRNHIMGLTEIRRMVGALGLNKPLRNQASQLFRTAQDEDLLRGRSIEAIASACVYAACRIDGHPRTFDEIAAVSKVARDRVRNAYTVMNRELGLPVPPADPRQYLSQIASAVDADSRTERKARRVLEAAADCQVTNGKNPLGVAAGALYLAAQRTGSLLNQTEVADAADVSPPTVRARYRALEGITPV